MEYRRLQSLFIEQLQKETGMSLNELSATAVDGGGLIGKIKRDADKKRSLSPNHIEYIVVDLVEKKKLSESDGETWKATLVAAWYTDSVVKDRIDRYKKSSKQDVTLEKISQWQNDTFNFFLDQYYKSPDKDLRVFALWILDLIKEQISGADIKAEPLTTNYFGNLTNSSLTSNLKIHVYRLITLEGNCVAFNLVYEVVAVANGATISIYSLKTLLTLKTLNTGKQRIYKLSFSPNGQFLVCVSNDETVQLWNVNIGGQLLKIVNAIENPDKRYRYTSVDFSPNSIFLATASSCLRGPAGDIQGKGDSSLYVTEIEKRRIKYRIRDFEYGIRRVQFSEDGSELIYIVDGPDRNCRIQARELLSTNLIYSYNLPQNAHGTNYNFLSPAANFIAIGYFGGRLGLLEARTGIKLWEKDIGSKLFNQYYNYGGARASFSSDSKILATNCSWGHGTIGDNVTRLWKTSTGEWLVSLHGHSAWVANSEFSSDSRLIATSSMDKTARIWDTKSGVELAVLKHSSSVWDVSFSQYGNYLATKSDDNITIWQVHER